MNTVPQRFAEKMIEVCRTVHRVVLSGFDVVRLAAHVSYLIYEINPEGRLEI